MWREAAMDENFFLRAVGAHGQQVAFGACSLLRLIPLATNYWPEVPCGGWGLGGSKHRYPPPTPGDKSMHPLYWKIDKNTVVCSK